VAVFEGGLDDGIKLRGDLGAAFGAAAVVIFSSDDDAAQVTFAEVVMCALPRRTFPAGESPARRPKLPPEPLGAVQEATNALKHFEKRPSWRVRKRAGRNEK
jgi:hypothetical protein